jgi:hypothetical protein
MACIDVDRRMAPALPRLIQKVIASVREWATELPKTLLSLALAGITVLGLAQFGAGNWIRCHFFDARGCLPYLELESTTTTVKTSDVDAVLIPYARQDRLPTDQTAFIYKHHRVVITNLGFSNVEELGIQVVATDSTQFLVLGLHVITGPGIRELDSRRSLSLRAIHFVPVQGVWRVFTTESTEIHVLTAEPIGIGQTAAGTEVQIRCEKCQTPFVKRRLI